MNRTHERFGYVLINIEILKSNTSAKTSQEIMLAYAKEQFQMIESDAYFEAYKHVLQQLKEMDKLQELPFERYLVQGSKDMRTPAYIEEIYAQHGDSIRN